jgi:hypothetical protein
MVAKFMTGKDVYSLQASLLRGIKVDSLSEKRKVVREEYRRYGCQSGVAAAGFGGPWCWRRY